MATRVCTKCGVEKDITEFPLRNRFTRRRPLIRKIKLRDNLLNNLELYPCGISQTAFQSHKEQAFIKSVRMDNEYQSVFGKLEG